MVRRYCRRRRWRFSTSYHTRFPEYLRHLVGVPDPAGRLQRDVSRVRPLQPQHEPQQCRLAGSVVADDADVLARADRQRKVVKDDTSAIGLRDTPQGELRHRCDRS